MGPGVPQLLEVLAVLSVSLQNNHPKPVSCDWLAWARQAFCPDLVLPKNAQHLDLVPCRVWRKAGLGQGARYLKGSSSPSGLPLKHPTQAWCHPCCILSVHGATGLH